LPYSVNETTAGEVDERAVRIFRKRDQAELFGDPVV
jgi:hypothetical protein